METTVTKNIRNLYCKLPYRKTDLLQVMIKVRVSPEKSLADSTFSHGLRYPRNFKSIVETTTTFERHYALTFETPYKVRF